MVIVKKLNPEDYSQDRCNALLEKEFVEKVNVQLSLKKFVRRENDFL